MSNWIYRKNIWNSSAPVISLGPTLDAFFLLLDFSKEIRIVISCPDLPRKTLQKGFWEDSKIALLQGPGLGGNGRPDGSQNS